MIFSNFFKRRRQDQAVNALYLALVEQARRPEFYSRCGVPDSLEGRYDMIILHAYLLFRRLNACAPDKLEAAKETAQQTFDFMFTDMDQNLREMGVTDLAVGKRVQKMASAFYGRVHAYDKALEQGDQALVDALTRNLYQGAADAGQGAALMADYVKRQIRHMADFGDDDVLAGRPHFEGCSV